MAHVSADSRYKLYLDGEWIGEGPAAGDLMNYRYESYGYDYPVPLSEGEHVIAVEVLSYGRMGPENEIHERGGFIFEGSVQNDQGALLEDLSTPGEWRVFEDQSFGADYSLGGIPYFCAVGFTESIDFRKSVGSWQDLDFHDHEWGRVVLLPRGGIPVFSDPPTFTVSPWLLMPRDVPPMEKERQTFLRVAVGSEDSLQLDWQGLFDGDATLTVQTDSVVTVVLEPSSYVTAYPQLEFEGGEGSLVRLTYGEAFSSNWTKDLRDDPTGRDIEGYSDSLIVGSGRHFYAPVQWRAFRYLKLEIQTKDVPLVLHRLDLITSGYPLEQKASWNCERALLNDLWPLSWNSLRTGAHEHLQDSPYYERLQYVGDTLIQSLTIFRLTGDARLWKRAVLDFNASRLPMGLTQSRYPSCQAQVIPTFSLVYINMVEEYVLHTGDLQTPRLCLRGLEQIVGWFEDHLTDEGLLGILPWWNFVDWTLEWPGGDPSGMTSAEPHNKKPSSTHNFLFVHAVQSLSRIYQWLGESEKSVRMRDRADALLKMIRKKFWDSQKRLFVENPGSNVCSEHANVLAILTDAVSLDEQCGIAKSLDGQAPLIRCGYQFEFYLARALSKTGRNDLMVKRLNHWQKVFDLHLVTTPERRLEEGAVSRSDNHAWSAWTPHWMLAELLGVQSMAPGFKEIRISPGLGGLSFAEGDMPLPTGVLRLKVEENETEWSISGELPPAMYQLKDLSGKVHELSGGIVDLAGRKDS